MGYSVVVCIVMWMGCRYGIDLDLGGSGCHGWCIFDGD